MAERHVKFSQVCDVLSGFAFKSQQFGDTGLPIARIRDVVRGFAETYYEGDYDEKYVLESGDILIGMDGDFNLAHWKGGKALLNQRVCKVIPKEDIIDAGYLYYYLPIKLKEIWQSTPFVTVKHLSVKQINDIDIPLPPLPIQKQIAAVLEKADTLRSQCKQMERELNQLAQSVFLEMFGDPVTNPKGWGLIPCKELCRQITVGIVVKPSSYYVEDGVPALRSLNVRDNRINRENWVYFDPVVNETQLQKTRVYTGDVVIVRSGQPGTASVVPPDLDGINAIDILIARPIAEQLNSLYLSSFLNSAGGRQLVLSSERGQIQKHLNVGELGNAQIPVPPIEMQNEFERIFSEIGKLKSINSEKLVQAENQFNSLMQNAFSGKLTLTKAA